MIANIETPFAGEAQSPAASIQLALTGIPSLDGQLAQTVTCGGVVLVGALNGGNGPMFAAQITRNVLEREGRVTYVSTHTELDDLRARVVSSSIGWPYDKLVDGRMWSDVTVAGQLLLREASGSDEFIERSEAVHQRMEENLTFVLRRDFRTDPVEVLEGILASIDVPDCLVLDMLEILPKEQDERVDLHVYKIRLAERVMARLSEYAAAHHIPVVVFCDIRAKKYTGVTKRVEVKHVSEFAPMEPVWDVFVGLTCLPPAPENRDKQSWANEQYANLVRPGKETLIPLRVDFEVQRLTEYDPKATPGAVSEMARARAIHAKSHFRGFMKFRRSAFAKLCELDHPPSINVYTACLLFTTFKKGPDYGRFFIGRETLASKLGLGSKQVRTALKNLEEADLIQRTGRLRGRGTEYQLVGFGLPDDEEGFFLLAQNLRDESRKNFLADPELLRIWLVMIFLARYSLSVDGAVGRGQLPFDLEAIRKLSKDSVEAVECRLFGLMEQGRVKEVMLPGFDEHVLEIVNYDIYQQGAYYRKDPGSLRANPWQRRGQLGATI